MSHHHHGTKAERATDVRPTVVLVGRPNAGKSSLFNRLTGASAKVGNFPGVTVDVMEAEVVVGEVRLRVVDLPGLYSLDGNDAERDEGVARGFLQGLKKHGEGGAVMVQVLDATCPAVGLRLTP